MAIGARAQSAKTYLEKKFEEFESGEFVEFLVVLWPDNLLK